MNNKFEIIKINNNALNAFISLEEVKRIINNKNNSKEKIVKDFNEKIESKKFNKLYKNLIKTICKIYKFKNKNIWFQKRPTVRVFFENEIGTSYHTDYWYGHGKNTHTVWIPISEINKGNGLRFVNQSISYVRGTSLMKKNLKSKNLNKYNNFLNKRSNEILIKRGEAIVFNSKTLHGSPKNYSDKTRVSFDFRFFTGNDFGSKERNNFVKFKNGIESKVLIHRNSWLKYIIGGKKISTMYQHILLNEFIKNNKLISHSTEAEIEKLNYPILDSYLYNEKIKGILVASKDLIPNKYLKFLGKNKFNKKIGFALENTITKI